MNRENFYLIILPVLMVPIIAEAQSMSGSMEVFTTDPEPGEEIKALLKLTNSNYTGVREDVFVRYSIVDSNEQLITAESGTFPMTDSRDIVLKLDLPNDLVPGHYSFTAEMEYSGGNRIFRDEFTVGAENNNAFLYALTGIILVIVVGIIFISRR